VDRVDRWLNAQRGWRRLLIGWLAIAPALLLMGLWWSAWGNIDADVTVPIGTVLLRVAIVAVAGIPLAAVQVRPLRRRRKSRPWEPGFSWRMIAGMYVMMTGWGVSTYGNTRTLAWQQHQHHLLSGALLLSVVGYGVMLIWNGRYYRKLRRQAEADAQAAGQAAAG
jgi:hypothetical protein